MIGSLGFPKGLISVEAKVGASGRRADIVCYALMPELVPLLVVECKAEPSFAEAEAQAFGYNGFLSAPFLCLAGGDELMTLWLSGGSVCKIPYLPTFRELCDAVR